MSIWVRVQHFLELIRFSHTIFALPFAMLSAVIAWAQADSIFRWRDLAGILICMVTARSAAMAFNRLVDRDIDKENPRTARRHIPAGLLSVRAVTLFTLVMSLCLPRCCCFCWATRGPNAGRAFVITGFQRP